MIRFDHISDLTNADMLARLTGPIKKINTTNLVTAGFSHSSLQKLELLLETGVTRNLILKQTDIKTDWLSQRSNDRFGRERMLLDEPMLSKIWSVIHCPYIAFAGDNQATGLLMHDLSAQLFPDIREPIDRSSEHIIIDRIASLHALFWDSPELKRLSWLASPKDYLSLVGPGEHEQDKFCPPPPALNENILLGWKLAFEILPARIKTFLTRPIDEIFSPWQDLPSTLLHGDLKIANMAILADNLALFDWSLMGFAPCGVELGWYLAVNATRLSGTKEEFIDQYRSYLESHLQLNMEEHTWQRMIHLAIVSGAMMLLWNKALARKGGTQRGLEEWEWWVDRVGEAIR